MEPINPPWNSPKRIPEANSPPISPMKSPRSYPEVSPPEMKSPWRTPEMKSPLRFNLGRQSSKAPTEWSVEEDYFTDGGEDGGVVAEMAAGVRLLFLANEGDLDGIKEMLDSGVDVNFRDIDQRAALHIAASQGQNDVVRFLLGRGAEVDPHDRWGSTPLADAIHYQNQDVIELLEKHGAKRPTTPMHVQDGGEVPEYEIDPKELDFSNTFNISKGTFRAASWRGIQVAVKTLGDHVIMDEEKIVAFRDELALYQLIRHPNVVQFLGAVTQSCPMMIITEYLPKGDLNAFLDRKGALRPSEVVKYALDIARGMNYLHQRKPEAIIHRDLEPSNILRDGSGHLKVADFGLSKVQKVAKSVKGDRSITFQESSWRYMAPEVFRNEEYDTKVDVFSFALILQEMIEGCQPFSSMLEREVPKAYCAGDRPPFRALEKNYPYGLKELIVECWNEKPYKRPTFSDIIKNLEKTSNKIERRKRHKLHFTVLNCFRSLRKNKMEKDGSTPSSHASISIIS